VKISSESFSPVHALATRISSFDKQAIAETKRLVNLNSLPSDAEIALEWDAFIASLGRHAAQSRKKLENCSSAASTHPEM
jgi:hypothetical protein